MENKYILSYDLGTTASKAVLFDLKLNTVYQIKKSYPISYPKEGWAEQNPEDFWNAVTSSTVEILQKTNVNKEDIVALTFDCQMNCTIPIDHEGDPLMKCISWLDTRASSVTKKFTRGLIKIAGFGLRKLLMFIKVTGGAPGVNGKDPISHILWIKEHEPDIYEKTYKFLSVKDFVIFRCTKNAVTSRDLGHTSWMMDSNLGIFNWSDRILNHFKIDKEKLPEIKRSVETAGKLTKDAASKLGLNEGIPIFVGSGDLTSAAIGSGAILDNQLIICLGTADWVAAHTPERLKDLLHYTGSISSSQDNYLCISKQETGSACFDWIVKEMFKDKVNEFEGKLEQLYNYLDSTVQKSPVGAKNLIFTPWMFGERSPLNDPDVRAGFYNLSLNHTREDLLRATFEGVGYNIKWALNIVEKLVGRSQKINFIGGGAKSEIWCQIIANILERDIVQMMEPDLVGARGSAIVSLVGMDLLKSFSDAIPLIKIRKEFKPNPDNAVIYRKLFSEFMKIYKSNKKMFKILNK